MQRRKFLAATAAAIPAIAIGKEIPAQRTGKGFVVKAKKSRFEETTKLYGNSPNDIKVSMKDTNGDLTIFEYTGNVKGGPPLHIHLHQDEIFFIVEGNYTFKVGEDIHQLTAGDTIFLPRQVPHTFAQTSGTGKMFFLFTPSGKMEEYFRVLSKLTAPPTPEQGAKIFADHDMKVVGPPLEV
jgi:quercetin 2,3-dioxygenase